MSKAITVQAANQSGELVFSATSIKKHKLQLLQDAIRAVCDTGGVIRYQMHGAKAWGMWVCQPGGLHADRDQSAVWPCAKAEG